MTGELVELDEWRETHVASAPESAQTAPLMPPHDLEAEEAILGACFLGGHKAPLETLRPESFYADIHAKIFEAVQGLAAEQSPIDAVTVASWFKVRGRFNLQLAQDLANLLDNATFANVRAHVRIVHDHWRVRQAMGVMSMAEARGRLGCPDAQEYLDDAVRKLSAIARMGVQSPIESNESIMKRIVATFNGGASMDRGLPIGLRIFDQMTGGLHPGHKATLAARRGCGKTSLALHIAICVAARANVRVLFMSTEQPRGELFERVLSYHSGVPSSRFKAVGSITDDEVARIYGVAQTVLKLGIRFDDRPGMHVGDIAARARLEADDTTDKRPLGLVIVDYVQRLGAPPGLERAEKFERVSHASGQLKDLAKELGVPVLELAQQNNKARAVDYGSQVERDSDEVFFLEKDEHIKDQDLVPRKLIIDKQRNGPTGEIDLKFEGATSRFYDWDSR